MKRPLRIALGLAVGLAFVWATLRGTSWAELWAGVAALRLEQALLAAGFIMLAYAVRIRRWQILLRAFALRTGYRQAAGPFLASFALNNLLPLRVGDIARTFAFRDRLGVAPSRVAATLIVERLWDLMALLVFLALGLAQLAILDPMLRDLAVTAMAAGAAALLVVLAAPGRIRRLLIGLHRGTGLGRIGSVAKGLRFGMRLTGALGRLSTPGRIASVGGLSLLGWALEGGVFLAVVLRDLPEILGAWLALATATLMTLLPGTPGHLGTFHFGARLGYAASGVEVGAATVAAVLAHALIWLPVTLAGGCGCWLRGCAVSPLHLKNGDRHDHHAGGPRGGTHRRHRRGLHRAFRVA